MKIQNNNYHLITKGLACSSALLMLLLLLQFLFLSPKEAYSQTISCNSSSGVSGCHFKPRVQDGSGRNVPDGQFTGSHARHSGYSTITTKRQYAYACTKCHPSSGYTNSHQTGYKNITGNSLPKSKYSAGAGVNGRIANTNTPAFGNCGTIYCHSNGRASDMGQLRYSSARWGGTEGCLGCHGGRASATGAAAKSVGNFTLTTTHSQHLKYPAANINCQICHAKTIQTDAWTLKTYTAATHHVNGVRDVTFTDINYASYTSYKSNDSGSSANTRICANTSCHGGKTRGTWTSSSPLNEDHPCAHCHGTAGTLASTPVTGANRYNLRFFAPGYKKTGTAGTSTDQLVSSNDRRVGSHFKHLSSAYTKNIKCNECHTVPSTPFGGGNHTLNTPRFNSSTLDFSQSSSAKILIGVASGSNPAQLSTFTGYTNGTANKAATCSSVYCHGNRMKNGEIGGTYRKPYWNYSAMINYTDPAATVCARCHAYPPTSASHSTSTACSGCHTNISATDNKTILNKSLHIDGRVQAAGGDCLGCHSTLVNADFVRPSRHVNNGTTTKIVTNFDCIVCHAEGDAASSGTTITRTSLHTGTTTTAGSVELRNVDNAVTGAGTANTNYWVWPNRRANGALAKGSANTTARDNMDSFCMGCHDANGASTIAVNNSNNGLIVGASVVSTVRTVTGTGNTNTNNANLAQRPFNTNDKLQNTRDTAITGNGTTVGTHRLTSYGRVLNVKDQFNSGNVAGTLWASHHNLNQFTKRYTSNNTTAGTGLPTGIWTAYVTKENFTLSGTGAGTGANAGLHCSDCHLNEVNAHGSVNSWYMLAGAATGSDSDVAPGTAGSTSSAEISCFRCHLSSQYGNDTNGTAGQFQHSGCANVDVVTGTASEAPFGNACHGCHGGFGNATLAVNKDVVGTGSATFGRAALGAIHGTNETYRPGGATADSKRYRFMSGASMRYFNPSGTAAADWTAASGGTCYTNAAAEQWGSCSKHSGGNNSGTFNKGRALSY